MSVPEGLKNSLNAIREISTEIYHQYVPIIDDDTAISQFADPIINNKVVQNEFISSLIQRIVYTQFEIKYFRNPLQVLEGDQIPLGYQGQEIYVNPAKGRKFNPDDFAGLLTKYESDVKVQYMALNMDVQYPVTILRQSLKKAFVSWTELETFIDQLSNSLYNGAYIDEFRFTKNIISSAYKDNKAIIEKISAPTTEELAKQFVTRARALFLNFQTPSSNYNAWNKMGGYGRPIVTFTAPEDIIFIIKNDLRAYLDVNVLASAFNMDKTDLLGNIITVDNFDVYDDDGSIIYDGSNIVGLIADRRWFRIKRQDMFLDTFYNPNNRTWQYYLNLIKMYNFSLFANGVIFATSLPTGVKITDVTIQDLNVTDGENLKNITVNPANTTDTLSVEVDSTNSSNVTASVTDNKTLNVNITGSVTSPLKLTFKATNFEKEITLNYSQSQNTVQTVSTRSTKSTTSK